VAREYPAAPVVGVGAVVVDGDRVVLIRRRHPPRAGEWSLPGGRVELGETLEDALRRELREEIGLEVEVGPIVETFDRIHRDGGGRVRFHFVIVDFLCRPTGGTLTAGDDAAEAVWATAADVVRLGVNPHAAAVLRKGLAMAAPAGGHGAVHL
jgi:mutator protein MutT